MEESDLVLCNIFHTLHRLQYNTSYECISYLAIVESLQCTHDATISCFHCSVGHIFSTHSSMPIHFADIHMMNSSTGPELTL